MRLSTAVTAACIFGSALASPVKRAGQFFRQCTVPNTVALTFDDGPFDTTKQIVDILNGASVKGTFFWNGANRGCIYDPVNVDRIQYAYNSGHQVASHTWSHKDLSTLSAEQIDDELRRLDLAFVKVLGISPAYIRPPYGNYNDQVLSVANANNQDVVNWDLDTGDSVGKDAAYAKAEFDQRINAKASTILSIAHETYPHSVNDVLPYAIERLKAAGYNLVTVAECLGGSPYSESHTPQTRDDTWHC